MSHEDVGDAGFLEIWNHLDDGGSYFSRTLAEDSGPLQRLEGPSGWRSFALPFSTTPGGPSPTRLELNVVLPAGGVVRLTDLRLAA